PVGAAAPRNTGRPEGESPPASSFSVASRTTNPDTPPGAACGLSVSSAGAEANGTSYAPAITADGRFVAFPGDATNLVRRDTNGAVDVFVHDGMKGMTLSGCIDAGRAPRGPRGGTDHRADIKASHLAPAAGHRPPACPAIPG